MNNLLIITLEIGKAIFIPSTMLTIALGVGVMLLWSRFERAGRWVLTIAASTLVLIGILPISDWIAKPLENRFPPIRELPETAAGIIVLGGAINPDLTADWGQPQLNDHSERLFSFMALARKYPNLQFVFSGGVGAFTNQTLTETDIAVDLLGSLGMDTDRIIRERRSRNTCENAIYTAQLVKPLETQTWVLITSAMDMPRAVGAFRKVGFRVVPYPVDYNTNRVPGLELWPNVISNLRSFDHSVHEWVGLVGYRMLGCSNSFFPGPLH